jgi:hypothetical protein
MVIVIEKGIFKWKKYTKVHLETQKFFCDFMRNEKYNIICDLPEERGV